SGQCGGGGFLVGGRGAVCRRRLDGGAVPGGIAGRRRDPARAAPLRGPLRRGDGDLPPVRTVVQFGAGNIGRGFMGHLFSDAGFETVFVDVLPSLLTALNERRSYPLRLVGPDRFETLTIRTVRAV